VTFTVLAIAFLLFIVLIAVIGFRAAKKQSTESNDPSTEKCSLCRKSFPKIKLIERQVGDYKVMYFCRECVENLYKNISSIE
jgi:predicted SprT family Zn-dependent metalloprotease